MSVNGTIGLPGSGKSYSAVQDVVIRELKKKNPKPIHTNLPLNLDMLAQLHDLDVSIITIWEDSQQFAETFVHHEKSCGPNCTHAGHEHDGCLVIWDELQDHIPVTYSKSPIITGFQDWIAKHRHYGCDFHWMSQAYESVHVDCRRRTFSFTYCESMEKRPFGKGKFKRVRYGKDPKTHDPHWLFPYKEEVVKLEKEIYLCYKSFEIAGSGQTGANGFEIPTFIRKYIWIISGLLLMLAGTVIYAIKRIDPMEFQKRHQKIANTKTATTTNAKPGEIKNAQKDTINIDGILCVNELCDIYQGGNYIGYIINKDTAVQKSVRWNLENQSTGDKR